MTNTKHDIELGMAIAQGLVCDIKDKGERTAQLKQALQEAGFNVRPNPDNAKKSIAIFEGVTRVTEEGETYIPEPKALGIALQVLIDARDSEPTEPYHLTGEQFTEGKRTLNKLLSNIAKSWDCPKVAVKGSKKAGYYFAMPEPTEAGEGEADPEPADFATELAELIQRHIEAGTYAMDIVETIRDQANRIAKAARKAA